MRAFVFFVFFVVFVLFVPGTWVVSAAAPQDDQLASPKLRIEWTDFKKLYDSKRAVVIDVRDAPSFEAGHIPGARSIPLDQIERRAAELEELGKPIVLYCA